MWGWLSDIWGGISSTVGSVYDTVADSYVGQGIESAYDYVVGSDLDTYYNATDQFETGSNYSSALGTAMEFAGGFMEVVAPGWFSHSNAFI